MKTYTLEEIKELCEKTTKGPWEANPEQVLVKGCRCGSCFDQNLDQWIVSSETRDMTKNDAHFIAASRTIVPHLVGQIEDLKGQVAMGIEATKFWAEAVDSYQGRIFTEKSEDSWNETEMKLIIRWQKDQIENGKIKFKKALEALSKIASCESRTKGDLPYIAQHTLKELVD